MAQLQINVGGQKAHLNDNIALNAAHLQGMDLSKAIDTNAIDNTNLLMGAGRQGIRASRWLANTKVGRKVTLPARQAMNRANMQIKTGMRGIQRGTTRFMNRAWGGSKDAFLDGAKTFGKGGEEAAQMTKGITNASKLTRARSLVRTGGTAVAAVAAGLEMAGGAREHARLGAAKNEQMAQSMDGSMNDIANGHTVKGLAGAAFGNVLKFGAAAGDQLDRDKASFAREWKSSGVLGKAGAVLNMAGSPFRSFGAGVDASAADLGAKSWEIGQAMDAAKSKSVVSRANSRIQPQAEPQAANEEPSEQLSSQPRLQLTKTTAQSRSR
jgi:hypothetical protein